MDNMETSLEVMSLNWEATGKTWSIWTHSVRREVAGLVALEASTPPSHPSPTIMQATCTSRTSLQPTKQPSHKPCFRTLTWTHSVPTFCRTRIRRRRTHNRCSWVIRILEKIWTLTIRWTRAASSNFSSSSSFTRWQTAIIHSSKPWTNSNCSFWWLSKTSWTPTRIS